MGKKGGWLSAVKKALRSSESKKKKDKRSQKSKSIIPCFGDPKSLDSNLSQTKAALINPLPHHPPIEDPKPTKPEKEPIEEAYSAAYAATVAAEAAAAAAARAAAEAVRLTSAKRFLGKSKEEIAAIKIQTAYRGYLARKAFRSSRRLGRLKSLIHGQSVKRQSKSALRNLQTLARVQSQVQARRVRMAEENQALQRQLLQKHEKEIKNIRSSMGSNWDARTKSKEQIEASLQSKKEAAERREKALAYAYTRQQTWRNSTKSTNPTFMDLNNPQWGWSWLDRWMAVRPWEAPVPTNAKSVGPTGRRLSRQSLSSPPSKRASWVRPTSSKGSVVDDDSKSLYSVQSERYTTSSLASSRTATSRSQTGSTRPTKAGSRLSTHGPSPLGPVKKGTPRTGPMVGSVKKRVSCTGPPASGVRRYSGPPRPKSNVVRSRTI